MKPYSIDLRQRVVEAYENGEGTHEELAEAFCVSLSWIEKLLRRWRETGRSLGRPDRGSLRPAAHGTRR